MFSIFAHSGDTVEEGVFDHVMDGHHWSGDGGFAVFWMVVFMVIIGFIVYLLLTQTGNQSKTGNSSDKPLDILKARYAKGEITKKQFTEMRKDIK